MAGVTKRDCCTASSSTRVSTMTSRRCHAKAPRVPSHTKRCESPRSSRRRRPRWRRSRTAPAPEPCQCRRLARIACRWHKLLRPCKCRTRARQERRRATARERAAGALRRPPGLQMRQASSNAVLRAATMAMKRPWKGYSWQQQRQKCDGAAAADIVSRRGRQGRRSTAGGVRFV